MSVQHVTTAKREDAREALWGFLGSFVVPAPTNTLRDEAAKALGAEVIGVIPVNSDDHVQALDRVARARCAEWLDREHGMELTFAREVVNKILDIYINSTTVRR